MSAGIVTKGYVLHARPWRETSLLLECFTATQGRVGLVARGVRGPRTRVARADLQPLRLLRLDYARRGELGTLRAAELEALHPLQGEALLSALYVNELLLRVLARDDPHGPLFAAYHALLGALAGAPPGGWLLRCFERDLLAAIGYAPVLVQEAHGGGALQPDRPYAYDSDQGPVPWVPGMPGEAIEGAALLALARGEAPPAPAQRALRRLLRRLISVHLGGRPLAAWSLARAHPRGPGRPA